MSDNATPKPRVRVKKYPAAIPRTVTTTEMRKAIEAHAEREGLSLGDAVRELVRAGLASVGHASD